MGRNLSWMIVIDCFLSLLSWIYWHDFRILSDMRTLSADWMANTSKPDTELQSTSHASEDLKQNSFFPRPVAPTTAQVCTSDSCFKHKINFSICQNRHPHGAAQESWNWNIWLVWCFMIFYLSGALLAVFDIRISIWW